MKPSSIRLVVYMSECFYFLAVTCLLVCSVGFYISVNHDANSIKQVGQEWQRQPLVDIQVVPQQAECPQNYTGLFNRYWPGTEVGCDCRLIFSWNIPLYS
jgi:hypothetical protein